MNDLLALGGLQSWKPVLMALVLPPVPWLLLVLLGAWRMRRHRATGAFAVVVGVAGVWLLGCTAVGEGIVRTLLKPPPALDAAAWAVPGAARGTTIVVLGGGRELAAPEYAGPSLKPATLARLRYGLWLGQRTDLPVAFTGGTGWAQPTGPSEAAIAAQIAKEEFRQPLAWTEGESRDTRGNAAQTVAWLQRMQVRQAILVTHAWHMPRALRLFRAAAGDSVRFVPAPIGPGRGDDRVFDWLPSSEGHDLVRSATREVLARLAGD